MIITIFRLKTGNEFEKLQIVFQRSVFIGILFAYIWYFKKSSQKTILNTPKHALILVGGKGTRLREVVDDVPKPMADIAGSPFLAHLITGLKQYGISSVTFLAGYMSEEIESYFGNGAEFGISVHYLIEKEPLGTGGALRNAADLIDDDEWYLVMNGDTFYDQPLDTFLRFDMEPETNVVIAGFQVPDRSRYGALEFDDSTKKLLGYREKADSEAGTVNGGLYLIKGAFISNLPGGKPFSLEKDVLSSDTEGIQVFEMEGRFHDIGVPSAYANFFISTYLNIKTKNQLERRALYQTAKGGNIWAVSDNASFPKKHGLYFTGSFSDFKKKSYQVSSQDVILHDFDIGSQETFFIRSLNAVVGHVDTQTVNFGAADFLTESIEDLDNLDEAVTAFTNETHHLLNYFQPAASARVPALFLDRDGVVIEHVNYPKYSDDVQLIGDIIPVLRHYQQQGWYLVVITNQSGIGRGYYSEKEYFEVNQAMVNQLAGQGIQINAVYHSPYFEKTSNLHYYQRPQTRKPGPGLFLDAASDLAIDLKRSVMIGNRSTDLLAGYWAGISSLGLFEPLGEKDKEEMEQAGNELGFAFRLLNKDNMPEWVYFL